MSVMQWIVVALAGSCLMRAASSAFGSGRIPQTVTYTLAYTIVWALWGAMLGLLWNCGL